MAEPINPAALHASRLSSHNGYLLLMIQPNPQPTFPPVQSPTKVVQHHPAMVLSGHAPVTDLAVLEGVT